METWQIDIAAYCGHLREFARRPTLYLRVTIYRRPFRKHFVELARRERYGVLNYGDAK